MPIGQYDDAYETPGWTAQWGYIPDADGEVFITPPEGLKWVNVTGTFFEDTLRPMNGTLNFLPSVRAIRVDGKTLILRQFKAILRHGVLENVKVLSPDGTKPVIPSSWTYNIRQRVGPSKTDYGLTVPTAEDTVDVYDLANELDVTVTDDFPLIRDYKIVSGATFERSFVWTQVGSSDLTGWTAKMQFRHPVTNVVLLELTKGSGITLGAEGQIGIKITAPQSELLILNTRYSLELYGPSLDPTVNFLTGKVSEVVPQVTV